MKLGKALALAAKWASAKDGGSQKIWTVGSGGLRFVLARRGPVLLVVRADDIPDGAAAFDARGPATLRATLERLGAGARAVPIEGGIRFTDGSQHADLTLVDARDIPPPPRFRGTTWTRLEPAQVMVVRQVAQAAAEVRADRPDLGWMRFAGGAVEATDEIVVARGELGAPLSIKMPSFVATLLPATKSGCAHVGDLGGGAAALAIGDAPSEADTIAVVDAGAATRSWFPDLREVWVQANAHPAEEIEVPRAELSRAVKAAAAGCDSKAVQIHVGPEGLVCGGGASRVVLPIEDPQSIGPVWVDSRAIGNALAKGGVMVTVGFRDATSPIEVRAQDFRALVYPIVECAEELSG